MRTHIAICIMIGLSMKSYNNLLQEPSESNLITSSPNSAVKQNQDHQKSETQNEVNDNLNELLKGLSTANNGWFSLLGFRVLLNNSLNIGGNMILGDGNHKYLDITNQ